MNSKSRKFFILYLIIFSKQIMSSPLSNATIHSNSGTEIDASASGLRQYVDSIKSTNPDLYAHLNPQVVELEDHRRKFLAGVIFSTSFVVGGGVVIRSNIISQTGVLYMLGLGVLGALGCEISSLLWEPQRSDYEKILNDHNLENSKDKLHLSFEIIPTPQSSSLAMRLMF